MLVGAEAKDRETYLTLKIAYTSWDVRTGGTNRFTAGEGAEHNPRLAIRVCLSTDTLQYFITLYHHDND